MNHRNFRKHTAVGHEELNFGIFVYDEHVTIICRGNANHPESARIRCIVASARASSPTSHDRTGHARHRTACARDDFFPDPPKHDFARHMEFIVFITVAMKATATGTTATICVACVLTPRA